MKKVLLIIGKDRFRDEEYLHPKEVFEKAGFRVTTAASVKGKCIGKLGAVVESDMTLAEVKVKDYDGVFFVGGPGASEYFNDPVAHRIAREAASSGNIYGAICIAPTILANAGVLKGKKATGFPDAETAVKAGGGIWTAKDVETDGDLITANGPQSARKWGEEIVRHLGNKA
jgi:protease I